MADQMDLTGVLVAATESTYNSFADSRTGEMRPGGVTHRLFVVTAFEEAPVEVRVPGTLAADFGQLRSVGFGTPVGLRVELTARPVAGGAARIERKLVGVLTTAGK